jgi:hypothetical protein
MSALNLSLTGDKRGSLHGYHGFGTCTIITIPSSFRSVFAIFIGVSDYWDITHLVDSLSARNRDHSSSRITPGGGSISLVMMSSVSGGVGTGQTDPALASSFMPPAATLACMRPSSPSLRVKPAISESYSSHSGIFEHGQVLVLSVCAVQRSVKSEPLTF